MKYGCSTFIDSYKFLSSSLDKLVENLDEDDFLILRKDFPDNCDILKKKIAYPYEYFNKIQDYQKPDAYLKKADFFSKLRNKCPDDNEIERTIQVTNLFNIKNGEELTSLYVKTDIILLADVFEKFMKVSTKHYGISPLYSVSVCSYTLQCCSKYTDIKLKTVQDKEMILLIENNIRGGYSSVMWDRNVKRTLCNDATNLYGHSTSKPLPFNEIKSEGNVCLNEKLNTPDDNDLGYFLEVDLIYPYNIRQKTQFFPVSPESKTISKDDFNDYKKKK